MVQYTILFDFELEGLSLKWAVLEGGNDDGRDTKGWKDGMRLKVEGRYEGERENDEGRV